MFNIDKFTVDMDKLLSKYKIKSGAFVSEKDNKIIAFTKLNKSTIKKETQLADAFVDLFNEINLLDIEDIKGITKLVQWAKIEAQLIEDTEKLKEDKLTKHEQEKIRFLLLSDSDRMLVKDYRERKTTAMKNQQYEEACKWRDMELKVLNKK